MRFNIYYGSGEDFSRQELIDSFDAIEQTENFLFDYIKGHHSNGGYIRTTLVSNSHRWYDYGSYRMFYLIIGKKK